MKIKVRITVNSILHEVEIDENRSLADFLRENLNLIGTKIGCNTGHCGSCSVLVDGKLVKSCVYKAVKAAGKKVLTIEGFTALDGLHPIQKAFIDAGAVQCGYCTPGMIMTSKALLDRNADPTEEEVRKALSGNLCRCTGYQKIVEAVLLAAKYLKNENAIKSREIVGATGYIGQRVPMPDAYEKVTGSLVFGADFKLPGSLYGKVLRSPIPHGKILSIDVTKARQLPGVIAVIAGPALDLPFYTVVGQSINDELLLAKDKVHYIGDEVAAIAAVSEEIAEKALSLIKVEYQELPAVFDVEEAMRTDSPKVHDFLDSNIANHMEFERGNIDRAFREAEVIVEDDFITSMVHQCYLEPHSVVAKWESSGKVTIWASTQSPRLSRITSARALGIKTERVRVIQCNIGGGFGGKLDYKLDPIAALLSKYAGGKPVKMVLTRQEEFMATLPRMPMKIHMKIGATKDGILLAKESRFIADNGAYNNYGVGILLSAVSRNDNLYRLKNIRTKADLVYTNKTATGAFRGFGCPQSHFAFECLLDMLAVKLRMDPAELRLKNATQTGDTTPHGWKINSCGLSECIKKATEKINWPQKTSLVKEKADDVIRGIGLACCLHVSGNRTFLPFFDGAAAYLRINEEGEVLIKTGEPDLGQGSKTVFSQIAAQELGISVDRITVANVDTQDSPHGLGTFADRTTTLAGNAVKDAAIKARKVILKTAAKKLKVNINELNIKDGMVYSKDNPRFQISFIEVAKIVSYENVGGNLLVAGKFTPQGVTMVDPQTKFGNISCAYPFVAQAAEVEVNKKTGGVKVLHIAAAHDLGKVINPLLAEGQVYGAIAMGIGYALTEDLKIVNGKVINDNFGKYRIMKADEMPKLDVMFVESNDPQGPYGAKGLGEPALTPTAAAIANAIYNAVGVRIKELPITPEKILAALEEKKKKVKTKE
jgi:putative selenate reductase molybdopterin-binding subunit